MTPSSHAGRQLSRILILGAGGQLGIELTRCFAGKSEVMVLGRDHCDLTDFDQIRSAISSAKPDVVLNAAAYTAVDRAESEQELAFRVNGEAAGVLAEETRKISALLVHYSTDYVFDGSKSGPWLEADQTSPLNVYGASKLEGERRIAESGEKYLIFRTSWVFSAQGNNFMRTMLRLGDERDELKIVNDQIGAPTSASAIAAASQQILNKLDTENDHSRPWGVYHMTCAGKTSWEGFAEAIFRRARSRRESGWAKVLGIPSAEYPTPAKRPKNSVLSNAKLYSMFGVKLPDWESALAQILQDAVTL